MIFDALRKNTKIIVLVVVVTFALGGTVAYFAMGDSGQQTDNQQIQHEDTSDPIVLVNDAEITTQEFEEQFGSFLQQQQQQQQGELAAHHYLSLRSNVLDNLVEQELIQQEAETKGFVDEVSDEDIEEEIDEIIAQGMVSSRDELEQALQYSGISMEEFNEQMKAQLAVQKMAEEKLAEAEVSDEELSEQLEEQGSERVAASHILISTQERSEAEAEELINEVVERLDAGEDFAELAQEYSDDPSAQQGGDLGEFGPGEMVPEFEAAAFALEEGEISNPVRSDFGYHLIELNEKLELSEDELAEQEDQIRDRMVNEREQQIIRDWLEELKAEAEIEIKDTEIKAYRAAQDGNYEAALEGYKEALTESADAYHLYFNIAQIYLEQDDTEAAMDAYREAIEKYPEQGDFYIELGSLYEMEDDYEAAIEVYEEGLAENEDNAEINYAIAELYREQGDEDKAIEHYERLVDLSGNDMTFLQGVVRAYQEMGLEEEADELEEKIKQIQQEQQEMMMQQMEQQMQQMDEEDIDDMENMEDAEEMEEEIELEIE